LNYIIIRQAKCSIQSRGKYFGITVTSLIDAFACSVTSSVLAIIIAVTLNNYSSTAKKYSEQKEYSGIAKTRFYIHKLVFLSIFVGLGTIFNELISSYFLNLNLRSRELEIGIFTTVFFPFVIFIITRILTLFLDNRNFEHSPQHSSSDNFFQNINSNTKNRVGKNSNNLRKSNDISSVENEIWEQVLDEFETRKRKRSLYAKLFSHYDGDQNKIKSEYMKIRFDEISIEHRSKHKESIFESIDTVIIENKKIGD
jgi:hypothetical protein